MKTTANQLLNKAASHMQSRAATYDKPDGERSMGKVVAMFNIAKGNDVLSESDGWLLMSLLKMVRDNQRSEPHTDSIEDLIAYSALYGEARLNNIKTVENINSAVGSDWIVWGGGKCPVDINKTVEVKFVDMEPDSERAGNYSWSHTNTRGDIIAYRVVK